MNGRNAAIVYRKELRDLLRDRRTIFSMFVVPVLVVPLVMVGFVKMAGTLGEKVRKETPSVMILGGEDSPKTASALRALNTFAFVPASDDYTNLISEKKINAAVSIPKGFDAAVQEGQTASVSIYTYGGEFKSMNAAQILNQFFRDMRDRIVTERLTARNVPRRLLDPFEIRQDNVAPPAKVSGNILGMILPYMMIMMCLTGAIYPAVDLTAGEKERGTMETILCSPIDRTSLVIGKMLVVLTTSLATACLSLCSNGVALVLLKKLAFDTTKANAFPLALDASPLAAVLIMVLPLAIFFSGSMIAIGLFSRSAKEANTYMQPLVMLAVIPAAFAALPGVELNYRFALVPVLNVSLAGREIIAGFFHWNYLAVVFGSMCLYAVIAVAVAVALFKRESILFRT